MSIFVAEKINDPYSISKARAFSLYQVHHVFLGRWDDAIEYGQKAAKIFLEIDDVHSWMPPACYLATSYAYQGNFSEALVDFTELIRLGVDRADLQLQCWGLAGQGFVQQRLGQFDEAIRSLQKAGELAEAIPDIAWCISVHADLGRVYLRQGHLKEGLEALEKSQGYYTGNLGGDSYASLRNGKAEACLLMVERSVGKERAQWLKKSGQACWVALKQKIEFVPGLPEALRLQGTYEWLKGKPAAAQKWWQQGLALAGKMGQRYDLGKVHFEMGLRLGNRDHLEKAEIIFTEISAEWDLKRAQQALEKM